MGKGAGFWPPSLSWWPMLPPGAPKLEVQTSILTSSRVASLRSHRPLAWFDTAPPPDPLVFPAKSRR